MRHGEKTAKSAIRYEITNILIWRLYHYNIQHQETHRAPPPSLRRRTNGAYQVLISSNPQALRLRGTGGHLYFYDTKVRIPSFVFLLLLYRAGVV